MFTNISKAKNREFNWKRFYRKKEKTLVKTGKKKLAAFYQPFKMCPADHQSDQKENETSLTNSKIINASKFKAM